MAKSIFNDEEIEFIKNNYSTMDTKEIAKILGKLPKQIKGKADNLGLKKGVALNPFSDEEIKIIKENYNIINTSEIAKLLNRTVKQVNDKAYNLGLRRDMLKHDYDESFFEIIDSEEKAYWLGFIYADGCISQIFNKDTGALKGRTLEITLAKIDKPHLEKFKKSIKTSKNITERISKIKNHEFESCRIQIYNKKICDDLIRLNCTPTKSLTLKFPSDNIVPNSLLNHFIRGYFDGDGCVSTDNKYSYIVNFVGTKNFLDGVQNIFRNEIGLTKTSIREKGNASQTSWGGFHNFSRIYEYLYSNASMYLDRKKEKFENAIDNKEYVRDVAYYHRNMMV